MQPKLIVVFTPGSDQEFVSRWLRKADTRPVWVPLDWSVDSISQHVRDRTPSALTTATGEAVFRFNPASVQVIGRATYKASLAAYAAAFNMPAPDQVLDEDNPKTKNKTARKKREANKASHNARGRKWWEHR